MLNPKFPDSLTKDEFIDSTAVSLHSPRHCTTVTMPTESNISMYTIIEEDGTSSHNTSFDSTDTMSPVRVIKDKIHSGKIFSRMPNSVDEQNVQQKRGIAKIPADDRVASTLDSDKDSNILIAENSNTFTQSLQAHEKDHSLTLGPAINITRARRGAVTKETIHDSPEPISLQEGERHCNSSMEDTSGVTSKDKSASGEDKSGVEGTKTNKQEELKKRRFSDTIKEHKPLIRTSSVNRMFADKENQTSTNSSSEQQKKQTPNLGHQRQGSLPAYMPRVQIPPRAQSPLALYQHKLSKKSQNSLPDSEAVFDQCPLALKDWRCSVTDSSSVADSKTSYKQVDLSKKGKKETAAQPRSKYDKCKIILYDV